MLSESDPQVQKEIQEQCQRILEYSGSGFAGARPVSININNVELLCAEAYRVSWKADGTRYMMYICGKGVVYMLDRSNTVFSVLNLQFPCAAGIGQSLEETLVDGEMVIDRSTDGEFQPCYLMYDIMQVEGDKTIATCNHKTRLLCIQHKILEPREIAAQNGSLDKAKEPFRIRGKRFWDIQDTEKVLKEKQTHKTDGLIFSPALDPYSPGHCGPSNHLLKWKPLHLNSVDFRLIIEEEKQSGNKHEKVGKLYVGDRALLESPVLSSADQIHSTTKRQVHRYAELDLKSQRNQKAEKYDGRIIECNWNAETGWGFMRLREDKNIPNELTTAESVVKSIQQPVTKSKLLEIVKRAPVVL